ncbi:hypothetical protein ABPG74_021415 [Tetrahymena malaccensis]
MTQLEANIDFSSQKLIFKLDQRQEFDYKVIQIDKEIFTFDFHKIKEELIKFLQDDHKIQNVEIMQLTNNQLQFISQKHCSDNQQFECLFGAVDYLDYYFNDIRQLVFDLPRAYSSYSERLVLKDQELIIENDNIKVKSQNFYSLRFRNYIGEIQDHMICVVFYKIIGLQHIPQQNILQKFFVQFQPLEILKITKDQLMHFIQKVLTIIAEGNYFYSLSKSAIFINPQQNCLEFIALPFHQNNAYGQDILYCENQILLQIQRLQQDFQYINPQRGTEIFIGDCLYQQNLTQVQRELPLLCFSQQMGFPLYWFLFHNIAYMEIGPFQSLKNKQFIVYKINDFYFYYDGKVNNQNEKHSLNQDNKNQIYCFSQAQHDFIAQCYEQTRFRSNQNQNNCQKSSQSLNELFQESFKQNHNLVFEGCLMQNLPHGECKIKIFLNPLAKQRILSLNSTEPFKEALFKKNIEGNFDHGILDGEGYIYSYLNERQKEKIYFDNFIDVPCLQNQERVGNISMHFGKWKQRCVKIERYQGQLLLNKQYNYIYYDASEQNKKEGRELRQFRSIICYKDKKQQQEQVKGKKVFINIGKTENRVNYQKLFLKTNDLMGSEQIKVYVLYDIDEPRKISAKLANNIIFGFTENNLQTNSQCITYINLSLITDVSQLHIENQLDSSKSKIKGLNYKIYQDLPFKIQQKIFYNINNLDFSYCDQLFEDYLKRVFRFENIEIYKHLGQHADETNKRRQSSNFRNPSNQMNVNIKYSLIIRGCNLLNINYSIFNQINLRQLDISRAKVRDDFLNCLGTDETQYLTSLNISYTTLLYSSVHNFFLQDKPKYYLETFICRNIQIQKNNIVNSVRALFRHILQSDLLQNVKYLDISENPQVNEDHLRIIYGHLTQLNHLKISQCQGIHGNDHQYLYIISEKLNSNLFKLDFSGNQISFSYLQQSQIYRSLHVLDIQNCTFKDTNPNLFEYLQTQKDLYKIKLDYQIFAQNNFFFLENIFKYCKKMRKIYLLVKVNDRFDIEVLQRFINSDKLINCLELNIYFNFQNDKNQQISNKEMNAKNYNKLFEKNLFYVNHNPYVNIHLGKYQIVNKEANDIDIKFNFQQLRSLKSGFIYQATQEQQSQFQNKFYLSSQLENEYANTINLSNHLIQDIENQDIEPYLNLAKNNQNIVKFIYDRQEIDSKKCQKIISNIMNSNINKLILLSSLSINNNLEGLSNLVVLQLNELKIELQEYSIFEQFNNFQLIIVNTLQIQFKQQNKLDKAHLSKFISIISVNKMLKISLENYNQNNSENKENQLSNIFSCFSEKYFTKCTKFCLELKGINYSSDKDYQRISTMIENMLGCCQFSLTYLDSRMKNYNYLIDEISKQINKFSYLELHLNNLDNNIIKFISSQNYLDNLILRIKDQESHKQLPHLFKLPIKKLQIYSENRNNNEKIQKKIQKEQNQITTQIYLNDQQLI